MSLIFETKMPITIMLMIGGALLSPIFYCQQASGKQFKDIKFSNDLSVVMEAELNCGFVCSDLLSNRCFDPEFNFDMSLLPEESPWMETKIMGYWPKRILASSLIKDNYPGTIMFKPDFSYDDCCPKVCLILHDNELILRYSENLTYISVVVLREDDKSLSNDIKDINYLADRIFKFGEDIDLVETGRYGEISYGFTKYYTELLKMLKNDYKLEHDNRDWRYYIFWWADSDKVGYLVFSKTGNYAVSNGGGPTRVSNIWWFESGKYLKGGAPQYPQVKPPSKEVAEKLNGLGWKMVALDQKESNQIINSKKLLEEGKAIIQTNGKKNNTLIKYIIVIGLLLLSTVFVISLRYYRRNNRLK